MKQTKTRVLCLLLAALLLVSLTACGEKTSESEDNNLIKLGDYTLLYKGAYITEDYAGSDALVLTLDYTNNGKEATSYLWSILETVMQNGTQLEAATIFTDYDTFETLAQDQWTDVASGETLEIHTAYVLSDTTNPVEVTFALLDGSKSGKITVDPTTLSREEASDQGGETDATDAVDATEAAGTGDELLDWWNGEWYGWWTMNGCTGYYEGMEGQWWDVCGVIDIASDYTGTVTLWDVDYTKSAPMAEASVSLNASGTGEHGTLYSESGRFTDVEMAPADWIVDPGLMSYTNMNYDGFLCIDGTYENGENGYSYEIYLRPWGMKWDDVETESRPYYYDSWYLPLIEAGAFMPDSIDTSAVSDSTESEETQGSDSAATNAPGGDGIVTEEQVQKGYVWMSDVAENIFDVTYEELAAYFGVDGAFDKEEYSEYMEKNYRYYKWISSEDDTHYIYVNFAEDESGVYKVSSFNTSGFTGSEAESKYLDIVKAESAGN